MSKIDSRKEKEWLHFFLSEEKLYYHLSTQLKHDLYGMLSKQGSDEQAGFTSLTFDQKKKAPWILL